MGLCPVGAQPPVGLHVFTFQLSHLHFLVPLVHSVELLSHQDLITGTQLLPRYCPVSKTTGTEDFAWSGQLRLRSESDSWPQTFLCACFLVSIGYSYSCVQVLASFPLGAPHL